jgi:hypothetical protein
MDATKEFIFKAFVCFRCTFKAFGVILWHFKVVQINRDVIHVYCHYLKIKKINKIIFFFLGVPLSESLADFQCPTTSSYMYSVLTFCVDCGCWFWCSGIPDSNALVTTCCSQEIRIGRMPTKLINTVTMTTACVFLSLEQKRCNGNDLKPQIVSHSTPTRPGACW